MALNILIVDDSAVMRSIVIKVLKISNLQIGKIFQASNGREALEVIDQNWIDLALVDINMPLMNGIDFLYAVRANPETAGLAVLVISSESQETRKEAVLQQNASFVHKPFTPELLRDEILKMTGVNHV